MSPSSQKTKRERLDVLVLERGLAESRERAKALILAGLVVVNDKTEDKAGTLIPVDAELRLKGEYCPYVSRGGLKLEGALAHFQVDPSDWTCMDVGASTGGFTDCLLQKGARKVYAFDVGTNQLSWKLRQDPRVTSREGFHVKDLVRSDIIEPRLDLIVVDVSFISLRSVLPFLKTFLMEGATLLALVKPQFEVGKDRLGKNGVVRDEVLQKEAVEGVREILRSFGNEPSEGFPSTIKGPKGNQEYFVIFKLSV